MRRDFKCPYSMLDSDIICEHKIGRVELPDAVTLHNHDGFEIIIFLSGDVSIIVEAVEKKLHRGDIIVVSPYTFHGINLTIDDVLQVKDYERIVLNIRPEILGWISDKENDLHAFLSDLGMGKPGLIHVDEGTLGDFVAMLDELESALKNDSFGSSLLTKVKLCEFVVKLARYSFGAKVTSYKNRMPTLVSQIFGYIDENVSKPLTVEEVAKALNHNSDYISRVFKSATGNALKHYISAKKIATAKKYLGQGYSPSDVCFMVGYENYSSFSRSFRSHIGLSPKQCQQNQH